MSVVDQYEKPTRTVRIATGAGQARIASIRAELVRAKIMSTSGLADTVPQLERDLVAAEAEADGDAIVFVFVALSADALEALKLAHPTADEALMFDVHTFPPALLAAACVGAGDDDGLSVEEAARLWDTFSSGDCEALYNAAWGVATTANLRPFSVSDIDKPGQTSVPNSTIADLEELHIASS